MRKLNELWALLVVEYDELGFALVPIEPLDFWRVDEVPPGRDRVERVPNYGVSKSQSSFEKRDDSDGPRCTA